MTLSDEPERAAVGPAPTPVYMLTEDYFLPRRAQRAAAWELGVFDRCITFAPESDCRGVLHPLGSPMSLSQTCRALVPEPLAVVVARPRFAVPSPPRPTRGGKGFVPVNQHAGTLIAFATAPGQTASDIGQASGPYAKELTS